MADVEWAQHSNEEVLRAFVTAPRIFGPWEEWPEVYGGPRYAWSRREVFPGPSWKTGGSVSVQRSSGVPGYAVSWHDGKEDRYKSDFQTPEEAMAYGDAWLIGAGHRMQATPMKSEEPK